MGVDRAAVSPTQAAEGRTGPTMVIQSRVFGRHSVDLANRGGMAVPARRVSLAVDMLASAEAVGRTGRVVARLENAAGDAGWQRPAAMGRSLPGWELRGSQKGGAAVGKTKRGKGTKWMVLGDGQGVPLGIRLESASPAEVTLADATLKEVRVPRPKGRPRQKPKRVIADRGYDSDPLRKRWKKRGIELIAPYRNNNKERRYHDGRKLRRYKRRWIIERTNAWLGQFRRLLVRHDHFLSIYRAFFYLACMWITLRKCL